MRPARGFGCQRGGAFEEGRGGGEHHPALALEPRTVEVSGNVLVGHRCRLRPVPGAAIRIDFWIGCLRECAVDLASLDRPAAP